MDNKTIMLQEIEQHKHELVLDMFKVARVIGFKEDKWDYYYLLEDLDRGIYCLSGVMGFTTLKGNIPEKEYNSLVDIWNMNTKGGKAA